MSRNKYILYITLVLGIVLVVAFAVQLKKLQDPNTVFSAHDPYRAKIARRRLIKTAWKRAPQTLQFRPDVLVKFRAGVSADTITQITTRFNDQLQDEIEAVPGLTTIHHPDNTEAQALSQNGIER